MKNPRGSDEAFVQEMMLEDQPPTPCDWTRLCHLLDELDRAPENERPVLFAAARRAAAENEAAASLVDRKAEILGFVEAKPAAG